MALLGVDLVERRVRLLVEGDVVEDVELRLGTEVRQVRDAGGAQVLLRLHRHVARVARVRLTGDRVEHRADERDRRRLVERIEDRGGRVRQQQHVGLVDLLEAADGRPVEADPVGERLLVQAPQRHPHVLPRPGQVGELEVHHGRAVQLGEGEHVARLRGPVTCQHAGAERRGVVAVQQVSKGHASLLLWSQTWRFSRRGGRRASPPREERGQWWRRFPVPAVAGRRRRLARTRSS